MKFLGLSLVQFKTHITWKFLEGTHSSFQLVLTPEELKFSAVMKWHH